MDSPVSLSLLLTNDDGIDAPGIRALEAAVRQALPHATVLVAAPMSEWSSCGHRVTTDAAIRIEQREGGRIAVDGSPADCVRLALHTLLPGLDWVIGGINQGANLGADIVHSGTVAAARESVLHGRQGLACSHYRRSGTSFDWPQAIRLVAALLPGLVAQRLPPGRLWNVNLPQRGDGADPEAVRCPADISPLPLDYVHEPLAGGWRYRNDYHNRARQPGGDVATCMGGSISVSEIGPW